MTDWTSCPDTDCGVPAEVVDDWTDPTSRVRQVTSSCVNLHRLTTHDGRRDHMPLDRQPSCGACGHEQHSPASCGWGETCPCAFVPTPGTP